MTRKVSTACLQVTIWELKGKALELSSQFTTAQMAFYKELSDGQANSFSGQWPAPRVVMIAILTLSEPKPNISFLLLAPNPSLCFHEPFILGW